MTDIQFRLGHNEYLRFQKFILKHSGLNFPENKRSELEKGIMKALSNAPAGITSVDGYYAYLNRTGVKAAQDELERLINVLTIGETHFFRNSAQFDALAAHVLPLLIAQKREVAALVSQPIPQLRIWSAGCSTGEEPYSIAILLRELIPDIEKWQILILGTDINADSLERARQATYRGWSFREDEAKLKRGLYFDQQGHLYRLHDTIRRQVTFAQHNLIEDDFPSPLNGIAAMDIILCRNVTIYFPPEVTQQLIKKFHATLAEGGWLLVGHSEPSIIAYQDFRAHTFPKAILYQKASRPLPSQNGKGHSRNSKGHSSKFDSNPTMPLQTARLNNGHMTQRLRQATARLTPPQTGLLGATAKLKNTGLLRESAVDTEKSAAKRYEEAQLLLRQGKAEKAIRLLKALIADNEKYGPALCLLARTYADLGRCLEARSWSQRAIKCDSLNPKAYYILALLDENDGFLGQAIENFKKMIYIDANNPLPHFHLAVLYKKEGQMEMAQRSLSNAIRILQMLPKDKILPESGESVGWLLQTAQKMLKEK